MAGETINERGSWTNISTADSMLLDDFSDGATRATIAAALTTGQESNYPLLDLQLTVSIGTPVADGAVHVYRRNKADGTNEQSAPTATYKQQYVGTFTLSAIAATTYYYIYGIPNDDPSAVYYLENSQATTITAALATRARTYKAAA